MPGHTKKPQYCIEDLVEGITATNRYPEIATGTPVGNEFPNDASTELDRQWAADGAKGQHEVKQVKIIVKLSSGGGEELDRIQLDDWEVVDGEQLGDAITMKTMILVSRSKMEVGDHIEVVAVTNA